MRHSFRLSAASVIPLILSLGLFLSVPLMAQFREAPSAPERVAAQFATAADAVFTWYDAPIFLAYIYDRYEFFHPTEKPFVIETGSAEQSLARSLREPADAAAGSMNPFILPHVIIGARLIHATAAVLLSENTDAHGELRSTLGLYKTVMYTEVITQIAKNLVQRTRPDGSDSKSFFSGHSSVTFAAASYLQREVDAALVAWDALGGDALLRDATRAGVASILYGWAGYVGYSRMHDHKHFLSDVIVGALVGTLIGNLVHDQVRGDGTPSLPAIGAGASDAGPFISLHLQF